MAQADDRTEHPIMPLARDRSSAMRCSYSSTNCRRVWSQEVCRQCGACMPTRRRDGAVRSNRGRQRTILIKHWRRDFFRWVYDERLIDFSEISHGPRSRTNTVSQRFSFPNQKIKRKLPLYVVGNKQSLMIESQIRLRLHMGTTPGVELGVHGWRLGCPDNSA